MIARLLASSVGRFALIGVVNTGIDVVLLLMLTGFGVPLWPANALSTGTALVFSFFANRSFAFRGDAGQKRKQAPLFLAVTLLGLWVLQPFVMWLILPVLDGFLDAPWPMLFAKGVATVVSMTWNYLLYSRLVFRGNSGPRDARNSAELG